MTPRLAFIAAAALGVMVSALVQLSDPGGAGACSCGAPGTPQEELAAFEAVFAGRVRSIEHTFDLDAQSVSPWDHTRVGFTVNTVWKGDVTRSIEVATPPTGGSCGYPFEEGKEFIVYAYGSAAEGGFTASLCSRTAPLGEAQEDLQALGRGEAPRGEASGATPRPPEGAGAGSAGAVLAVVVVGALVAAGIVVYARRGRG